MFLSVEMKVRFYFSPLPGWVLIFLLLAAAGPARADVTWSSNTLILTETWDNYLTDPLVSGSDSSNLTVASNDKQDNKRRAGLEVTGTVDASSQFLLTDPVSLDTLAISNLVFSWPGGAFGFPLDGGPWTGPAIPGGPSPITTTISVSFTIPQLEAVGKSIGTYTASIDVCGKTKNNLACPADPMADLATLNISVTIPEINSAIIEFPPASGTGGSDLSVTWDGSSTAGTSTDSINICVGTDSSIGVDVLVSSTNAFQVTDGITAVPYTLTLNGDDITDGVSSISAASATDLLCSAWNIPLEIGFANATLATTPTDGATPFLDQVTLTVTPQ
jgi:hypothetical protein